MPVCWLFHLLLFTTFSWQGSPIDTTDDATFGLRFTRESRIQMNYMDIGKSWKSIWMYSIFWSLDDVDFWTNLWSNPSMKLEGACIEVPSILNKKGAKYNALLMVNFEVSMSSRFLHCMVGTLWNFLVSCFLLLYSPKKVGYSIRIEFISIQFNSFCKRCPCLELPICRICSKNDSELMKLIRCL